MKKIKLNSKLSLNKETVANLNEVRGGGGDPKVPWTSIVDSGMDSVGCHFMASCCPCWTFSFCTEVPTNPPTTTTP